MFSKLPTALCNEILWDLDFTIQSDVVGFVCLCVCFCSTVPQFLSNAKNNLKLTSYHITGSCISALKSLERTWNLQQYTLTIPSYSHIRGYLDYETYPEWNLCASTVLPVCACLYVAKTYTDLKCIWVVRAKDMKIL